ncbi:hypothetical protein ABVK25_009413 [Lepraria finkii]|uniref:Mitochondrial mRNA-processing protein COX24 C-terminal domain-containing protein n=1 Tax=Lepraria finkii TaxID=1340010 RepID=A0ABR4AXU7_9LECA
MPGAPQAHTKNLGSTISKLLRRSEDGFFSNRLLQRSKEKPRPSGNKAIKAGRDKQKKLIRKKLVKRELVKKQINLHLKMRRKGGFKKKKKIGRIRTREQN